MARQITMKKWLYMDTRLCVASAVAILLAGCASSGNHAPVEDRTTGAGVSMVAAGTMPAVARDPSKPLPGAENLGKPGYYTVKPGDTMIRVGLETGQNWKDLVAWNNLENPNVIEVGQVMRVVPPGADAGVATKPVALARVETRP